MYNRLTFFRSALTNLPVIRTIFQTLESPQASTGDDLRESDQHKQTATGERDVVQVLKTRRSRENTSCPNGRPRTRRVAPSLEDTMRQKV